MNGATLNAVLEDRVKPKQVISTLQADVLRAAWISQEYTQDFCVALQENLNAAKTVSLNHALSGAETNKQMLIALVEQATLEKVVNLIKKGNYAR